MASAAPRRVTPAMRILLVASAVLVGLAGLQLFVFPNETETKFAWTIQPPLTAAALGGFYLAALVLTLLSARQRLWANARAFALGTLVFASLILLATVIHGDRFHWDGPTTYARVQAWLWISVYAVYPAMLLAGWLHQRRQPGGDPGRRLPLPGWLRVVLAAQAAVLAGVGVALLAAPTSTSDALWPWELTPLTGRAIAAWMVGLAVVIANALRENDWERIRAAPPTYAVVGVSQLVVVARYADDFDWGDVRSWLYFGVFAVVAATGATAMYVAARARVVTGAVEYSY